MCTLELQVSDTENNNITTVLLPNSFKDCQNLTVSAEYVSLRNFHQRNNLGTTNIIER